MPSEGQSLAKHAGVARHGWNQGLALCQAVLEHKRSHPKDNKLHWLKIKDTMTND